MIKINQSQEKHLQILRDKVFNIIEYPSFKILIDELPKIIDDFDISGKSICLLERTLLYGSSLFGGLFFRSTVVSYDCSPESACERGSYNQSMIEHDGFIDFKNIVYLDQINNFLLPPDKFDLIFIPNLVHHFRSQEQLFEQCYLALKNNGKIIIFEPTFREIHQAPHDYLRYTPYGMDHALKESGFTNCTFIESGDAFEAINYILSIMKSKRNDHLFNKWCDELIVDINKFKVNKKDIVKANARFPTSFIFYASK